MKSILNENDLRVSFTTDIIDPIKNEYWVLVSNYSIDYDFKFPLQSTSFVDYERTLVFFDSIKYGLKFKKCVFINPIQIYKVVGFERDILFSDCTFNEKVSLRGYDAIITFSNCTFNYPFTAENAKLEGKVKFWECNFFHNVNFRNTTFQELADFWRSTFHKEMIFYKTDFNKTLVLSAVTFKENVLFTYTLVEKLMLLRGTNAEKGFDISLAIINGKLGLFGFDLKNFKETKFIENEKEYEKAVSEKAIIPIKNKRETFRILKDVLESQKNLSESLKFKAIEKEILRVELKHLSKPNWFDKLRKWMIIRLKKYKLWLNYNRFSKTNNRLEIFNLWLNKWSNDYGSSYGRAFVFIMLIGWFIFYLSLLSTKTYFFSIYYNDWEFSNGFKFFIEFLNPLHKSDYMGGNVELSTGFYLIDFIGRIIVGYGIYQFIQAFRKYK
jgi:hypothetical protein